MILNIILDKFVFVNNNIAFQLPTFRTVYGIVFNKN